MTGSIPHPRLPLISSPRLFLNKSVFTGLLKWMLTSYSGWSCHFLTVGIQVQLHMWVIPQLSIPFPSPFSPHKFLSFSFLWIPSLPYFLSIMFLSTPPLLPFFSSPSPAQGEDCHHEDPPCGVITTHLENPSYCTMQCTFQKKINQIVSLPSDTKLTPNISVRRDWCQHGTEFDTSRMCSKKLTPASRLWRIVLMY